MKTISEDRLKAVKDFLRKYINDMFQSMTATFMAALDAQLNKISFLYSKCKAETTQLASKLQGLEKTKQSIAKMLNYVDQLEQQLCPKTPPPFRGQYYQKSEKNNEGSITTRAFGVSRINEASTLSARRFQRKNSQINVDSKKIAIQKQNKNTSIHQRIFRQYKDKP